MCSEQHSTPVQDRLLAWFAGQARDLPWRGGASPWGVLVSEVMLQQTPVPRVMPVWRQWLARWPEPTGLAAEPAAEAIRAWGRLGYPRRAMRLHAAAMVITAEHGGQVPSTYEALRTLPGVGDYTAAAVVSFAFGGRAVVLDVNVRRFFARYFDGQPAPAAQVTAAERARAEALLPAEAPAAWAAATMEFGQLICTARNPACDRCPVADGCAWLSRGRPGAGTRTTKPQSYVGTDRQVRGLIVAHLHAGPAARPTLDALWPADPIQLARALDSLVADGLVDPIAPATYALPGDG